AGRHSVSGAETSGSMGRGKVPEYTATGSGRSTERRSRARFPVARRSGCGRSKGEVDDDEAPVTPGGRRSLPARRGERDVGGAAVDTSRRADGRCDAVRRLRVRQGIDLLPRLQRRHALRQVQVPVSRVPGSLTELEATGTAIFSRAPA